MSQALAKRKPFGFIAVSKDTIMPDFHKSGWKDVQKETANEFKGRDRHNFPLVVILVIAPFERDLAVLEVEDTVVGDGDAMGISAKIVDDAGRRFEWRFTVDDPFFEIASVEKIQEMLWVVQIALLAEETDVLGLQKMKELAPEFTG